MKSTKDQPADRACPHCGAWRVTVRMVESSDGAYEDYCFTCAACGHRWWVDGIDS